MNESLEKQKAKVIHLKTDYKKGEYFPIYDLQGDGLLSQPSGFGLTKSIYYHLYIYSEREIKKGELGVYANKILNNPIKWDDRGIKQFLYPIIASTDQSLELPRPSNEFIQAYIKAYNEGTPIEEIMVDMIDKEEVWGLPNKPYMQYIGTFLKVKPDNTITISPIEESWSDIYEMYKKYSKDMYNIHDYPDNFLTWLKKYYKPPIKLKK